MTNTDRDAIMKAIREFDFDDYGMDDVGFALHADPSSQEWVPALADRIIAALTPARPQADGKMIEVRNDVTGAVLGYIRMPGGTTAVLPDRGAGAHDG